MSFDAKLWVQSSASEAVAAEARDVKPESGESEGQSSATSLARGRRRH